LNSRTACGVARECLGRTRGPRLLPGATNEEREKAMRHRTVRVLLTIAGVLWFVGFFLVGCSGRRERASDSAYLEEIAKWREKRINNLENPAGWLSLVGLHWLREGRNTFGTDSSNAVVFPAGKGPGLMGTITVEDSVARVTIAPGVQVFHNGDRVSTMVLHHDQEKGVEPTVLSFGTLSWHLIERGGRLGVRVKDSESRALKEFKRIECFPVDPRWRIEGVLERHDPPRTVEITNVLGDVTHEPSPGTLVFEVDGKVCRLDPVAEPSDKELFVVFGDETNGKETYGGGRFLGVAWPGSDGKVVLDFNKAYNPPCAFSPYATCPLPPPQNRLSVAIPAGEKTYEKPGH
jgi:uncharacterized protein (DUF1684 family)